MSLPQNSQKDRKIKQWRQDFMEYLANLGFVEKYSTKLLGYVDEDISQQLWIMILEVTDSKWELLLDQSADAPMSYVSGLIYRNLKSKTSPIFYKLLKHQKYELPWQEVESMM